MRFVTGNVQDCVPECRISKNDLEMVLSHSHTLTRLEGSTHPLKGAKGSGTSSSPSKFFRKFTSNDESHVNYLHVQYLLQSLAGRTLVSCENIANQRGTDLRCKMPLATTFDVLDC